MRYDIVVCEPGNNKPVCTFRSIIAEDEPPQIGEERLFRLDIETKKGYFTVCDVTVRFVRKQKGILFTETSGPTGKEGLQDCNWCKIFAEPTAKNYEAGLKRLITFANYLKQKR